jgi:serine O-acetyltransferase
VKTCSAIRHDFYAYKQRAKIKSLLSAVIYLTLFHPGFQLLVSIRMQAGLAKIPVFGSILRRCVWYMTSIWTSSEVSFMATLGEGVYFPHPTGVVIGDSWDIGPHATIMQGVTLGRKASENAPASRSSIGEGVTVSAGAKIIGELSIGDFSVVGANAVVTKSLPAHCVAVGVPAKIIKMKNENRIL